MNQLLKITLSSALIFLLSGCGETDTTDTTTMNTSSTGTTSDTGDYSMDSMDGMDSYSMTDMQTYDSDYSADDASNDADSTSSDDNQDQAGDYQSSMGALNMDSLNTNDPYLYGSGDDSSSADGAPRYYLLGDVTVTIEGQQPFNLHTAADSAHQIAPPYQQLNFMGQHVVYISAYSIAEDRLNEEAGSVMFKFTVNDLTVTGCYPLEFPYNVGGQVCVEGVQTLNGSSRVLMTGYIQNANMCTDDTCQETFVGSLSFKTQVLAYQQY